MSYRPNPFRQRMAERAASDQEFVKLFSPQMIEQLDDAPFGGGVHIFRSAPGGGKTTLLRAFTPPALRAFWNARSAPDMAEAYRRLRTVGALDDRDGPQLLGVLLSCASGYADLPPGVSRANHGLFRALVNARVIIRTLRSLAALLGFDALEQLERVTMSYDPLAVDLQEIPTSLSAAQLASWAADWERQVYADIDSVTADLDGTGPAHERLEGVLWLQSVRFQYDDRAVAPERLLLIDDVHKLRRKQRALIIGELAELRPRISVWLAERNIALGNQLLAQGVRLERDIREYALEDIWKTTPRTQFAAFAKSILRRRLAHQEALPAAAFSAYLREHFEPGELPKQLRDGVSKAIQELSRYDRNIRYAEWLADATKQSKDLSVESLKHLLVTQILLAREDSRRQMTLELVPLSVGDRTDRDTSQVQAAAELFARERYSIPYYFGIERLCVLATNNVEELLSMAAALYEALLAKQILRKELLLTPQEQERLLRDVARRRWTFIPKNHTEGRRAQRLLDAVGVFCREKTFSPNASYAPGVTGVRLSERELQTLTDDGNPVAKYLTPVRRVLAECVAENLLVTKASSESGSRDKGTVFYLNRALCAHYGLPLQLGGWQDVGAEELLTWMNRGRKAGKLKVLKGGL